MTARLSPRQSEAVTLCQTLTYKQAAVVMGISVNTVKKMLRDARIKGQS